MGQEEGGEACELRRTLVSGYCLTHYSRLSRYLRLSRAAFT